MKWNKPELDHALTMLILRAISLFCFCLCGLTVKAQTVAPSWRLELVANKTSSFSKNDNRQKIFVKLTNVSNRTLWVYNTSPLHDYDLLIKAHRGKEVPMTQRGQEIRRMQNEVLTRAVRVSLTNGASQTTEINLCTYYTLAPGTYVLYVSMKAVNEVDTEARLRKSQPPAKPAVSIPLTITD